MQRRTREIRVHTDIRGEHLRCITKFRLIIGRLKLVTEYGSRSFSDLYVGVLQVIYKTGSLGGCHEDHQLAMV